MSKNNTNNLYMEISIIIVTYNEESNIRKCLESISKQNYPSNLLEILIIDDNSTDDTVKIAKEFTNKIYFSGKKNSEVSKAIGIKKSIYKHILFIDADNFFIDKDTILNLTRPFLKEKNLLCSYPYRFYLNNNDDLSNQYCSLFGINDPFQFYTKTRDHITHYKKFDMEVIFEEKEKYFKCNLFRNKLITLGSIACLLDKSKILKIFNNRDIFVHSEILNKVLIENDYSFALIKTDIYHNHCQSLKSLQKKLKRNVHYYLSKKIDRPEINDFHWLTTNKKKFIIAILKICSLIIPIYDSLKMYIQTKNKSSFMHVYISLYCLVTYSFLTIAFILKSFIYKNFFKFFRNNI
tara:strand:+ start:592 stop:1641 length:1050 start_codon:yes stop_codon:yes gene_type:complete